MPVADDWLIIGVTRGLDRLGIFTPRKRIGEFGRRTVVVIVVYRLAMITMTTMITMTSWDAGRSCLRVGCRWMFLVGRMGDRFVGGSFRMVRVVRDVHGLRTAFGIQRGPWIALRTNHQKRSYAARIAASAKIRKITTAELRMTSSTEGQETFVISVSTAMRKSANVG